MPEWRHHPLTGHAVRIAPARAERPNDFREGEAESRCPFCAGSEADTPEASDRLDDAEGNWLTRVVPNAYPAVDGEDGQQEVIIESPRHVSRFCDLTPAEATAAMTAWARRIVAWRNDRRFDYALVFKNEGRSAGASLQHIHSQVLVLPEVPAATAAMWNAIRCGTKPKEHPIASHGQWQATMPDAPRFAYETILRPVIGGPTVAQLADGDSAQGLATYLGQLISAIQKAAGHPDFNLVFQAAPASLAEELGDPWWIEIVPRSSVLAGMELATGLWVNAVPPEEAAGKIAEVLATSFAS